MDALKDKLISYRYSLKLPSDLTFGVEIEYEGASNEIISYYLQELKEYNEISDLGWINKEEADLIAWNENGDLKGGEVSSPIMTDDIKYWTDLKVILNMLKRHNAKITSKCGGHINIGSHAFKGKIENLKNFLLLWKLYKKEIYDFSSGEYNKIRTRKDKIILPITKELKLNKILENDLGLLNYIAKQGDFLSDKKHDVSFKKFDSNLYKKDSVLEIRLPNGTLDEAIWQNYINFFAKFILYCNKKIDSEKIIYKIKHNEHNSIELANLIFKNKEDKENFLIQTNKNNKIYKKELKAPLQY